jgi:hypothetical protein
MPTACRLGGRRWVKAAASCTRLRRQLAYAEELTELLTARSGTAASTANQADAPDVAGASVRGWVCPFEVP